MRPPDRTETVEGDARNKSGHDGRGRSGGGRQICHGFRSTTAGITPLSCEAAMAGRREDRRKCHGMSCFCRGGALRGLPPAVDPVLHRLRRRRESGSRIGSGMTTWPPAFAGVTKGGRGRRWRGGGETVAKCHEMSWRGAAAGVGCGHLVSFRSGRAVPLAGVRAPARARGGGNTSPVGSAGLFSDPGEAAPDAPSLSYTILHFGQSQAPARNEK